ncbi:hypothetical protein F5Y16DRAFT_364314 [Xylariaceae sp. FL0255]|nr:hypothetical protein F5Y16DRAFT_364314 [Xylariaceae sp. FL0255]
MTSFFLRKAGATDLNLYKAPPAYLLLFSLFTFAPAVPPSHINTIPTGFLFPFSHHHYSLLKACSSKSTLPSLSLSRPPAQ